MKGLLLQISEKKRGLLETSTGQKNPEEMKMLLDTYDLPKLNQDALSRASSTLIHEDEALMKVSQQGKWALDGSTAEFS